MESQKSNIPESYKTWSQTNDFLVGFMHLDQESFKTHITKLAITMLWFLYKSLLSVEKQCCQCMDIQNKEIIVQCIGMRMFGVLYFKNAQILVSSC